MTGFELTQTYFLVILSEKDVVKSPKIMAAGIPSQRSPGRKCCATDAYEGLKDVYGHNKNHFMFDTTIQRHFETSENRIP